MDGVPEKAITELLGEVRGGNRSAEAQLAELVYEELRRMARLYMRNERAGHTLQPTVVVHEAYLQLLGTECDWKNRSHFYAAAAQAMRRILIDYARARNASKRGGRQVKVELEDYMRFDDNQCESVLGLDEALDRLAKLDARQARIVELRFFGGLTEEEVADVLALSVRTVKRDWTTAKGWLRLELTK